MSLFDELHESMVRRIEVMQQGGSSHLVGLAIWLAIETYTRTPGPSRLTPEQGDELYDLLEPLFTATPQPVKPPPCQLPFDAALMRAEKERRTHAYRKAGKTWFNQPVVAA
jgi:hypothetical protein